MYYEVSNLVSNHKYSEWEIAHRNPFKDTRKKSERQPKTFYLTKDIPFNLFMAFSHGFSIKPHAFNLESERPETAFVNCIILDFDNMTKEQCRQVIGQLKSIPNAYGDWSSGMKTKFKQNEGIPNYEPEVWKYKVFFPPTRNVLCVYEDVDSAFIEAVKFFNPTRKNEEVIEVWGLWKKANNRKDKVTDPIFKDWILPDVAMLNNFRNQITYGVDVNQVEKFKEIDDTWMLRNLPVTMSKFTPTNKWSYKGLDWKIEDAEPEQSRKRKYDEDGIMEIERHLLNNCHFSYNSYSLPTTKSALALTIGKTHIDDLIMPLEGIRHVNAAWWNQVKQRKMNVELEMDSMKKSADLVGKTFARIYAEMRAQGDNRSFKVQALEDCCTALKFLHGPNLFSILDKEQKKAILHEVARAFMSAWNNYGTWRLRQKLRKTTTDEHVIELRNKWRDSRDNADFVDYCKALEKDMKRRMKEVESLKFPFDYHRRGFKKEVMETLLNGNVKLNNPQEFIERLRKFDISPRKDGEFTDKLLTSWFYQYRAEWNKLNEENHIGRKSKKSKYAELFKDMTKEEIEFWIDDSDLHRQMKKKLKEKFL